MRDRMNQILAKLCPDLQVLLVGLGFRAGASPNGWMPTEKSAELLKKHFPCRFISKYQVVPARQPNKSGAANPRRQAPPFFKRDNSIVLAMENDSLNADLLQDFRNVDFAPLFAYSGGVFRGS